MISILFEQPLTEVASRAGIEFWLPTDADPKAWRKQQAKAREAMQALAVVLGLTIHIAD